MNAPSALSPRPLTPNSAAPYGHMLGRGIDFAQAVATNDRPGFRNDATDFCHEHVFDTGGGETEIVWLHYRDPGPGIPRLEMHLLTEQAVVPLTGGAIIQILARSLPSAPHQPDPASLAALRIEPGQGLCMAPGIWHASLAPDGEVAGLMLTRRSTTRDLVAHLRDGTPATETIIVDCAALGWPPLRII